MLDTHQEVADVFAALQANHETGLNIGEKSATHPSCWCTMFDVKKGLSDVPGWAGLAQARCCAVLVGSWSRQRQRAPGMSLRPRCPSGPSSRPRPLAFSPEIFRHKPGRPGVVLDISEAQ